MDNESADLSIISRGLLECDFLILSVLVEVPPTSAVCLDQLPMHII